MAHGGGSRTHHATNPYPLGKSAGTSNDHHPQHNNAKSHGHDDDDFPAGTAMISDGGIAVFAAGNNNCRDAVGGSINSCHYYPGAYGSGDVATDTAGLVVYVAAVDTVAAGASQATSYGSGGGQMQKADFTATFLPKDIPKGSGILKLANDNCALIRSARRRCRSGLRGFFPVPSPTPSS